MKRLIVSNATDLLGCSDLANAYFYGKRNAVLIHNGTDLSRFTSARESRNVASDLRPAEAHLVTVGRISSQKNPFFLVQTIEELSRLRQDFVLHWAGTGEFFEQIQAEIEARNLQAYIQMLGRRTDIPQILAGCELFLLPSLFEGLPVVLIEAQASGLTCLISDTITQQTDAGGCRFLSLDAGAQGWAQEIDSMLRSDDRPLADPDQLRLFDIHNTVEELDRVYSK